MNTTLPFSIIVGGGGRGGQGGSGELPQGFTFVQVRDGIVVNRALFGAETLPDNWPDRNHWIRSDEAQIGWLVEGDSLVAPPPPEPQEPLRRMVQKSVIVTRLQEAGLLQAASDALAGDLYARERWYAADKSAIYADDPEAVALLEAIGADPEVILAP